MAITPNQKVLASVQIGSICFVCVAHGGSGAPGAAGGQGAIGLGGQSGPGGSCLFSFSRDGEKSLWR
jgi:hypothetical protein